jgi:hypothetical protein
MYNMPDQTAYMQTGYQYMPNARNQLPQNIQTHNPEGKGFNLVSQCVFDQMTRSEKLSYLKNYYESNADNPLERQKILKMMELL